MKCIKLCGLGIIQNFLKCANSERDATPNYFFYGSEMTAQLIRSNMSKLDFIGAAALGLSLGLMIGFSF